jgi:hypothetical protein
VVFGGDARQIQPVQVALEGSVLIVHPIGERLHGQCIVAFGLDGEDRPVNLNKLIVQGGPLLRKPAKVINVLLSQGEYSFLARTYSKSEIIAAQGKWGPRVRLWRQLLDRFR